MQEIDCIRKAQERGSVLSSFPVRPLTDRHLKRWGMYGVDRRQAIIDKFYETIEYDPNGGCWLWSGSLRNGYGVFNRVEGQKNAHRASWVMHRGPIGAGLHVLHKCDVSACCNPDHLFLGTHQDNMADMRAKGRNHYPEKKLTDDQKLEICSRWAERADDLGVEYGVHGAVIRTVWREGFLSRRHRKVGPKNFEEAMSWVTAAIGSIERIKALDPDQQTRLRQATIRLSNAERRHDRSR